MDIVCFVKKLLYIKTYTIVAGVNDCGKSSLTGVLRSEINNLGKIIDVDKITNLERIEDEAFNNCRNLKKILVKHSIIKKT